MYLMRTSSPEPKCITMCLKKLSGHIRQGFSFSRQHVSLERLHNMNTLGLAWWLIRIQIPPYLKLHPRGGVGGWECLILWMTQGSLDICIYRWNFAQYLTHFISILIWFNLNQFLSFNVPGAEAMSIVVQSKFMALSVNINKASLTF